MMEAGQGCDDEAAGDVEDTAEAVLTCVEDIGHWGSITGAPVTGISSLLMVNTLQVTEMTKCTVYTHTLHTFQVTEMTEGREK